MTSFCPKPKKPKKPSPEWVFWAVNLKNPGKRPTLVASYKENKFHTSFSIYFSKLLKKHKVEPSPRKRYKKPIFAQ